MTKIESKIIEYKDILSIILAALGVLASIISLFIAQSKEVVLWIAVILGSELFVVFLWALHLRELNKYNEEKRVLEEENLQLKNKIDNMDNSIISSERTHSREIERVTDLLGVIATNMKNASKLNNEFCIKIPAITEDSYHLLELLSKAGISDDKAKNELILSINKYSSSMFEIYKRYSTNLLSCVVLIEEAYLQIRHFSHKVSATIKMFDKPYDESINNRNEVIIFTAFRDKQSYDKHEREIGQSKYTIDGNADFIQCLKQEAYIVNNARRDSGHYLNEHVDFDQYYNCAAVVPIKCKKTDGTYRYYGYLCCDCLNSMEDNISQIFDRRSAQYLFALAQMYATFLETLDSNWMDRITFEEMPASFMQVICEKTCNSKN